MDLLSDQGLRLDGRRADELREIRCKLGVFDQPDGSAYLEQGNTKVLAAVYGPHQIRGSSRIKSLPDSAIVNCQYSMATFSTGERKRRPRGDRKSQEMTGHLKQALSAAIKTELYPRSQIDVFLEVLQADGGNYCTCVNAATLALIDAGIPINEYVIGCTASLANGDVPLIDISHLEETTGGPNLTVVAMPLSGQLWVILSILEESLKKYQDEYMVSTILHSLLEIVVAEMLERFHVDHLEKVVGVALQGCQQIYKILDREVRDHLSYTGCASYWGQNFGS